jgi:hypothetical protein
MTGVANGSENEVEAINKLAVDPTPAVCLPNHGASQPGRANQFTRSNFHSRFKEGPRRYNSHAYYSSKPANFASREHTRSHASALSVNQNCA